jgi:hypothetical protein
MHFLQPRKPLEGIDEPVVGQRQIGLGAAGIDYRVRGLA